MKNDQLLDFVSQQRQYGVSDEQIKAKLAASGWKEKDYAEVFINMTKDMYMDLENSNSADIYIPKPQILDTPDNLKRNDNLSKRSGGINFWPLIFLVVVIAVIGTIVFIFVSNNLTKESNLQKVPTATLSNDDKIKDENIYKNNVYGFNITIPFGWTLNDKPQNGSVIFISKNGSRANVSVVAEELENKSVEEYVDLTKKSLMDNFENFEILSESEVVTETMTGVILETRYQLENQLLHDIQYIRVLEDTAFVVTATNFEDDWNNTKEQCLSIVTSFDFD